MWCLRKSANYTEVFYLAQDSVIHIFVNSDNCNIELVCYEKIIFGLKLELSTEESIF